MTIDNYFSGIARLLGRYLFFPVLLVSSSISSSLAQISDTATLTIEVIAEFVPRRGTKFKVTQYADEQCSKRGRSERLLEKRNAKERHVFKPLAIKADSDFIFQVLFELKKLRQIKSCPSIARLSLTPGRDYRAIYQVDGEVLGCSLKVFDVSPLEQNGETVSRKGASNEGLELNIETPELACRKIGKTGYKNNLPVHTSLELEF